MALEIKRGQGNAGQWVKICGCRGFFHIDPMALGYLWDIYFKYSAIANAAVRVLPSVAC